MRRNVVIVLTLLLLAAVAGVLLWRGLRSSASAAGEQVRIQLRLGAPSGQPLARGTAVFLTVSLRAKTGPPAPGGAPVADAQGEQEAAIRLGREKRPWWRDLRLIRRTGDAEEETEFAVIPDSPQPYLEVDTDRAAHARLLLPPDHDLPAGPVTLEASWQAGDLSARSRPLALEVRTDSPAQAAAVFNARYFLEVDELDTATEILEEALETYPGNAALHSLRGQVFEESGELQAAAAAYSRALDLAMDRLPADAQEPPMIFIRQLQRVQAKMAERGANR